MLAKKLGLAYERTARLAEAKEILRAKQFVAVNAHGATSLSLDAEYQQIMPTVANEYGIKLIEGSQELDKNPSVYLDHCPLDDVGHKIIGHLLYAAVRDILNKQMNARLQLVASMS